MEVLPDDVMHVRHYQGHWYVNNDRINTMVEKEAPLPANLMDEVRSSLGMNWKKRGVYQKAKEAAASNGVEWIKTVERPAQYHKQKTP